MRTGLIVGGVISAAVHFGFLMVGQTVDGRPTTPPDTVVPVMPVDDLVADEPEPSEKVVDDDTAEENTPEVAPPMLPDIPTIGRISDLTIPPMRPIDPRTDRLIGDISVIPVNRAISRDAGSKIFNPTDLEEKPHATYQVEPGYPPDKKVQGESGSVVLGFVVDAHGNVVNIQVVSSSDAAFNSYAINALEKWRFRPGRKTGKAVNTRMIQPFKFSINQ